MNHDSIIYGYAFLIFVALFIPAFGYYFILRHESSILNPKNFDKYDPFFTSKEE